MILKKSGDSSKACLVLVNIFFFRKVLFNPFQHSIAFYTETRHSICTAKQMTGFLYEIQSWAETGLKASKLKADHAMYYGYFICAPHLRYFCWFY